MSSTLAQKPKPSIRAYKTQYAFNNSFYTYRTRVVNFQNVGTLTPVAGATASNCPRGRVLYEKGSKLYPGANPGVSTYMVGVYDPVTFLSGYIDPASKVFTPMNEGKPHTTVILDAEGDIIFGKNPDNGETDQGPGVFTLANSYFGANVDASGNLLVMGDTGIVGNTDISGSLVVWGPGTFHDDVEIKGNLTCRGNITQIDLTDMTSEQLSVTNNGTGPALIVNQLGANDIMNIKDDGVSVMFIKDGGNVGFGKTNPAYTVDVNGILNALRIYENGFPLIPTGSVMEFAGASAPSGWFFCDGTAVS